MWSALREGSGWSYSQRTLNTIGTRGGKKNYDNGGFDADDDDYDDEDDYNDNYNVCFLILEDLKQGWHQGKPINYDDDNEIDGNDDNYNEDDDDDDVNNDGIGFFSSYFFCRNLVFETPL